MKSAPKMARPSLKTEEVLAALVRLQGIQQHLHEVLASVGHSIEELKARYPELAPLIGRAAREDEDG